MKTDSIPAIIMLIGGAFACILGLMNGYDTTSFLVMILAVLIFFYILGCIVKIILDKNFPEMSDEVSEEENPDEEKENIESESREEFEQEPEE